MKVNKGVVDYINHYLIHGALPEKLDEFLIPLDTEGRMHLIPAGDVNAPHYWKKLSNIEWRPFLYDENAPGIPLLLDLKARIEEELKPDLLLVDSRTGFTESGSVATVLFADTVVSLFVHNRESLEGTRTFLRSLQSSLRPPGWRVRRRLWGAFAGADCERGESGSSRCSIHE